MTTIYHNNRCSTSRTALALLKEKTEEITIVNYLQDTLTKEELSEIIKKLGIAPIDLIRKKETIWKENYKDKKLTKAQIIAAMVKHPKLIERPIVIKGNKAVIGRPPTLVLDL